MGLGGESALSAVVLSRLRLLLALMAVSGLICSMIWLPGDGVIFHADSALSTAKHSDRAGRPAQGPAFHPSLGSSGVFLSLIK